MASRHHVAALVAALCACATGAQEIACDAAALTGLELDFSMAVELARLRIQCEGLWSDWFQASPATPAVRFTALCDRGEGIVGLSWDPDVEEALEVSCLTPRKTHFNRGRQTDLECGRGQLAHGLRATLGTDRPVELLCRSTWLIRADGDPLVALSMVEKRVVGYLRHAIESTADWLGSHSSWTSRLPAPVAVSMEQLARATRATVTVTTLGVVHAVGVLVRLGVRHHGRYAMREVAQGCNPTSHRRAARPGPFPLPGWWMCIA